MIEVIIEWVIIVYLVISKYSSTWEYLKDELYGKENIRNKSKEYIIKNLSMQIIIC